MSVTTAAPSAAAPGTARSDRDADRRRAAFRLAVRTYLRELAAQRWLAVAALVLPAIGTVCLAYLPPLIVADLVARLAAGEAATTAMVVPAVLAFLGVMLTGEALWRVTLHCLNRVDANGIESLYVQGVDALLAQDSTFFHENFAGSLTKRVLGFASQFENFVDTLVFDVAAQIVPLGSAAVILWQYDPLLVAVLFGTLALTTAIVVSLIRRRQVLVDAREEAWARVSGHVSDTLSNIDAVRAHASELREAAEHRRRVAHNRQLALRSWDYSNLRIDTVVAPLSVLANVLGLVLAVGVATREGGPGVAAVVVVFSYCITATRILFEFSQTYRTLERTTTEAAQFAELLLDGPTVLDPERPEPVRRGGAAVRFDAITTRSPPWRWNISGVVRSTPLRRPLVVSRSSISRRIPSTGPPARNCSTTGLDDVRLVGDQLRVEGGHPEPAEALRLAGVPDDVLQSHRGTVARPGRPGNPLRRHRPVPPDPRPAASSGGARRGRRLGRTGPRGQGPGSAGPPGR